MEPESRPGRCGLKRIDAIDVIRPNTNEVGVNNEKVNRTIRDLLVGFQPLYGDVLLCEQKFSSIGLKFNVFKCSALRIGDRHEFDIPELINLFGVHMQSLTVCR